MFTVSPSILSGDLLNLGGQLDRLAGLGNLHLDIDDGNFVRGISFGMDTVRAMAAHTDIPMDAHLEVLNPCDYVEDLCACGVKRMCAHIEALPYPSLFLSAARKGGAGACGLAVNLKTPAAQLLPYADQLDYVIFVSVEADCDGLPFRPGVLGKVREARAFLRPGTDIWVDGGVNTGNLEAIVRAGATGVVVGRAVFGADDPVKAYRELLDMAGRPGGEKSALPGTQGPGDSLALAGRFGGEE